MDEKKADENRVDKEAEPKETLKDITPTAAFGRMAMMWRYFSNRSPASTERRILNERQRITFLSGIRSPLTERILS